MATVFEGIRVIDLSQGLAGSLATMILADNGADVIKVEPPGGDPLRAEPAWIMWNRGKNGAVLDLETAEGRRAAAALARGADVLVESYPTGEAERLGLGYPALAAENPGLVYCSISAFGRKGAYARLPLADALVEAKSGAMVDLGKWMRRDAPTYRVRPNASYAAANLAVQGVAAALRVRDQTGLGQRLETSLLDGVSCYNPSGALRRQSELGLSPDPPSRDVSDPSFAYVAYLAARCKDGQWLQMTNHAGRLFRSWMRVAGLEHIFEDPRFAEAPSLFPSPADRLALRDLLLKRMREKTLEEWLDLFLTADVAADRFLTTQQAMDHPQTLHNGAVIEIDDPSAGRTRQLGPLVHFGETPSVVRGPAPRLGEHTEQVLARRPSPPHPEGTRLSQSRERGNSDQARHSDSAALVAESASDVDSPFPGIGRGGYPLGAGVRAAAPAPPFAGLTVLEFDNWLASPFGASLIADLGARVIKVEPPLGDEARWGSNGRARTFQGKESLVLDLKAPEARAIVRRLLERADALLHNMRGEAPQRLGIDYETVRRIHPRLVYVYAASYGSTGPGAGRGGFHPTAGALSGGVLWQLGRGNAPPAPDASLSLEETAAWSERLLQANEPSPDVTAGLSVGTALALGLYARERTGRGQYIETRMLTSNNYLCSDDFIRCAGKPPRAEADRDLRGLHALHRLYRARDGWVFLACAGEEEWRALCRAIGCERLPADPRFATTATRHVHDEPLIAALAQAFRAHDADAWEATLLASGVGCVRADGSDWSDFFLTDPSLRENGQIVDLPPRPGRGRMLRPGPAWRFSRTPAMAEGSSLFGADTPAILAELGLSPAEIGALRRDGVVVWEDAEAPDGP
jgi:crotonobetainyl-CoA:carnitine CoA-transferase CaiB-like acyl-CoA transferase